MVTGEQGSQSGSDTGGSKEKLDSTSVTLQIIFKLYNFFNPHFIIPQEGERDGDDVSLGMYDVIEYYMM